MWHPMVHGCSSTTPAPRTSTHWTWIFHRARIESRSGQSGFVLLQHLQASREFDRTHGFQCANLTWGIRSQSTRKNNGTHGAPVGASEAAWELPHSRPLTSEVLSLICIDRK